MFFAALDAALNNSKHKGEFQAKTLSSHRQQGLSSLISSERLKHLQKDFSSPNQELGRIV